MRHALSESPGGRRTLQPCSRSATIHPAMLAALGRDVELVRTDSGPVECAPIRFARTLALNASPTMDSVPQPSNSPGATVEHTLIDEALINGSEPTLRTTLSTSTR